MLRRAPPLCAATTPCHVKGSSSSSSSSSGLSLCRGASVRNTRGGSCTLRVGIRARARAAVASAVARSELPGHLCYRAAGVDDARRVVDFLAAATDGPPRDAARMARALESSYASLLALDGDDPSRRVVGFARVVSDGAFVAVIADLALDGALVADSPRHGVAFVRRLRDEVARIGRARGGPLGVRPTSLAAFAAGTEERTAFWRSEWRFYGSG